MKIENYISALLYRYQCVTVPGFGAFLTEIQSAEHDAESNTFYPPKKLISFNANLKNNDGLLANHIALQEKISYQEAVHLLERMVNSWTEKLQAKETLTIKNIGEIFLNVENSLVFEPNTPINYLTDSFGLSAIVSPAVKREELKAQIQELEEKAPIVFTPERKKNYSYLKYAAVFVVALTLGGSAFKVYRDQEIATQTLLVEKAVQEQVQNKIQQATFFIESPLPAVRMTVEKQAEIKMPYHVVAGAFRSEANADKAVRQLSELGYKSNKLEKNKFGLYPVLYGSYPTYSEAQKNMSQIQKSHNKEAWLLIKEI